MKLKQFKPINVTSIVEEEEPPQIVMISATAVDLADRPNGHTAVPFEVEWDDDRKRSWKVGMEALNAEDAISVVMSFWHGKEPVSYEHR